MSNISYSDYLEESKVFVYPLIGTVMTLASLLNTVNCVVMIKNKDLRKHNQFLIYITISLTEVLIDILYIIIMFWRQNGVEYFCMITFLLYIIGRESIQVHLLCLCIERCFALSVSLLNVFRKLITVKGRLLLSVVCVILSIVIFAPIVFMYGNKDVYPCGPETLFGSHIRFIFRYCRTVFSLQIILMVGIYLFIAKKIRTRTAPNSTEINHLGRTTIKVESCDLESKSKSMLNNSSQQITVVGNFVASSSTSKTLQISQRKQENSRTMPNHPKSNHPKRNQIEGKKQASRWKPQTLKMLRSAIFATVIPSIPMLALQTGDYFDPNFMKASLDVVISLCNALHAFVFPLVFIVTVKKAKCCPIT